MIEVIDHLSAAFVLELARLGWPPLADMVDGSPGRILVGNHHQFGQFVPPRVRFRPLKAPFSARSTTLGARPSSASPGYTDEGKDAIANPAIYSEEAGFEVSCWGICPRDEDVEPRARDLDYDFTRGLYTTLIATLQKIYANGFKLEGGQWRDIAHNQRVGREFFFVIVLGLPVLRLGQSPPAVKGWTPGERSIVSAAAPLAPPPVAQGYQFASSNVAPQIEDEYVTPDGQSAPGCEE